jgi:hypothetical protein
LRTDARAGGGNPYTDKIRLSVFRILPKRGRAGSG